MSIHTRLATAVSAAVVAAAMALPASASPSIPLNSGQEPTGGEAGGHGFFSYTIDGTEFCWTLSWRGIADPVAGHVHVAPRHVAGDIVIDLDTDGVGGPDVTGCRVITAELAAAITSDPGAYYVNLHNAGTSTCTTLASKPGPSEVSSSSRRGFFSLRELIMLPRDVMAGRMRATRL